MGLLALRDRKFFAMLLQEPEAAMRSAMKDGKLELTDDDVGTVVALINERNRVRLEADAMKLWDEYQRTLVWDNKDWPMGWPAYGPSGRGMP